MKRLFDFILPFFFKFVFWFRYRIEVKGLDRLNAETLKRKGGILFLPNHPTVFVDPSMITMALWSKFKTRPLIIDYMYQLPFIHWALRLMDAIPVPNFYSTSNSIKRKKNDEVIETVVEGLKSGDHFLLYPSGRLKSESRENIGATSAAHRIIQETPEANVVLVRTKGLWGSSFSKAITGETPPIFQTILQGLKFALLYNFLFFMPKRKVIIELEPAPSDFPYNASRLEMNAYLENWFNQPDGLTEQTGEKPGDSLVFVSYSMWGDKYLEIKKREKKEEQQYELDKIPENIKEKIKNKLKEISQVNFDEIKPDQMLSTDLGLDSLDISELVLFLQDEFDIKDIPTNALTSVGKLMAIASKQIKVSPPEEESAATDYSRWNIEFPHNSLTFPKGDILQEIFLNNCERMGNAQACCDLRSGIVTYSQLKMRVLILAEYIRKLQGDYIGILLPASVASYICVLATMIAGKIPLMINWTVGPRHLETVVELSEVQHVLTSWAFIDRLHSIDFNGIDNKLVMLEDLRREFSLADKIRGYMRSKLSTKRIMRIFDLDRITPNNQAILVFTSGTESMPKGVPLTHSNLLSMLHTIPEMVEIYADDVLLSILPPFHTFGLAACGIMPLLLGLRVAFSPDPTDGNALAKAFERWKITAVIGAPSFLKALLKAATQEQVQTLRIAVTGAEAAPPQLFELVKKRGKEGCIIEGYGITECSPVLTLNRLDDKKKKGVGKAIPCVELCIVHPETLELLEPNTEGLILARGPNVFHGYLNPGLKSPFVSVKDKEWYKTGDLGKLDEEGYLVISGRMKRFIKVGGEMVSLSAVESALYHKILEKGLEKNEEEGPTLAVCAKEKAGEKPKVTLFSRIELSADEANRYLKEEGFSNLVRIAEVVTVNELPLLGIGKVDYRRLESEYLVDKC